MKRSRTTITFIVVAALGVLIPSVAAAGIVNEVKAVTSQQTAYFQFDSVLPTTIGATDAANQIGLDRSNGNITG
jgi:hypothetical protein